ncbi:DUF2059 domain-containing protein [Arcicella sp. DC2W]|uniref:DUF2059 domain-containing protein n=1 Tax=Arcicella gelida TaxID=2984195 RepID=A0ABU5S699_9BACT|nr:DUF2059 domain-containing protein [Arcicella sp. DC2W]MEA5403944.1 DUF2059 domain-containing protein [Arcicella sp. DC2W]
MKVITVILFLLVSSTSFAQTDSTKAKDIKKLLEVSGTAKAVKTMMTQYMSMMKTSPVYKDAPAGFFDKVLTTIDYDEFIMLYVPIYDKHFTHSEIKELIAYHESPIGKKVIEKQPLIMSDSMQMGKEFGEKLGRKVYQQMQEEKGETEEPEEEDENK